MTGRVIAMVLAGGSGTRMGTDANKVYLPLADVPILAYSLIAFEACAAVTDIVLVARPADVVSLDASHDGNRAPLKTASCGNDTLHWAHANGALASGASVS